MKVINGGQMTKYEWMMAFEFEFADSSKKFYEVKVWVNSFCPSSSCGWSSDQSRLTVFFIQEKNIYYVCYDGVEEGTTKFVSWLGQLSSVPGAGFGRLL